MSILFVDNNSDLETFDLITKSMDLDSMDGEELEELFKAVDRSKCVQVEREEKKPGGGTRIVKRWLRAANVHHDSNVHKVVGNHHLLPKDHPQYQEESEATKPKEPKRKRKPKTEEAQQKADKAKSDLKSAAKKDKAGGTKKTKTIKKTEKTMPKSEKPEKKSTKKKSDETKTTKPVSSDTSKTSESTKPKKKKHGGLGHSPLDDAPVKNDHNIIDAAEKAHQEQKKKQAESKKTEEKPSEKTPEHETTHESTKTSDSKPQSEPPAPKSESKPEKASESEKPAEKTTSKQSEPPKSSGSTTSDSGKTSESKASSPAPKSEQGGDDGQPVSLVDKVKADLKAAAERDARMKADQAAKAKGGMSGNLAVTYAGELTDWKRGDPLPSHIQSEINKGNITLASNYRDIKFCMDPKSEIYGRYTDSKGESHNWYSPEHKAAATMKKYGRLEDWETSEGTKEMKKSIWGITKSQAYKNANPRARTKMEDTETCMKIMFLMGLRPDSTSGNGKSTAIGVTSLRGEHVIQKGTKVFLQFPGKKGVIQNHEVTDPELRQTLKRLKRKTTSVAANEGGKLFSIKYSDLLKSANAIGITPKDLRTLCGTRNAQSFVDNIPPSDDPDEVQKVMDQTAEHVSGILGNRPAEAQGAYINPSVYQKWSPKGYEAWQARQEKKG